MGLIDDVMTAPAWEEELGQSSVYKAIQNRAISVGIDPKEFMQLAYMESTFDPKARSGQGYHGLFQLNPAEYRGYMGESSTPYNIPSLYDSDVNARLAAEKYSKLRGGDFLEKAVRYNQGPTGGYQIMDAYKKDISIYDKIGNKGSWNRTRNMLFNMSDNDIMSVGSKYSSGKTIKKDGRGAVINAIMGTKENPKYNDIRKDKNVVKLYVENQSKKVGESASIVDQILKEM